MAQYVYDRSVVPITETLKLQVQFRDSAGNVKDTDGYFPSINIIDAASSDVVATTTSAVNRIGVGYYQYSLIVPEGFTIGVWNDIWTGTVDGYSVTAVFEFNVTSAGSIEAVGTTAPVLMAIGDDPVDIWTQAEITGINVLLKLLKARLKNTAFKPDGTPCDVFGVDEMLGFLCASLSEFNATPTITNYSFDNPTIYKLFPDAITQGAYLVAMAAQATVEAGREFTLNDNGVTINPPPVSSTIMSLYNAQLADYRGKLKEIKRNHRPGPIGFTAGGLLGSSPSVRKLRHLRERSVI